MCHVRVSNKMLKDFETHVVWLQNSVFMHYYISWVSSQHEALQRFFNRSSCDPPNWFGPSNQPELALVSVALSSWRQPQKVVKLQHKAYTTCPFISSSNHTAPCSHAHPCQHWPITNSTYSTWIKQAITSFNPRTSPVESGHCCGWSFSARCPSSSSPRSRFARWVGEFVESRFLWVPSWSGVGTSPVKDGFFSNISAIRRLTCNVGRPQLRWWWWGKWQRQVKAHVLKIMQDMMTRERRVCEPTHH